ncbi:hypothetical protein ABID22_003304 [Pontibacter aydingkolensis]|uniref:Collagen-like protein n=1 Tax=Pontibacter aydingkolensis TaxID=1911536 RepID=A0ABS7CU97_9BACT|nr:hypothetical protein [Pontibacter aydingkolensis]MBW7467426.1 hypothetical protein [Pontibacter aydingkolensis]
MYNKLIPAAVLILLLSAPIVKAQQVISKLVIREKEVYQVGSDNVLLADTLIMHRKATIHFNHDQPAFMGVNAAFISKNCKVIAKGLDGSLRRTGSSGSDGQNGSLTEINIHFETLGSLTIDTRGGNGDSGEDGVSEIAATSKSDGDGTFKSTAPVRQAKAGGAGGRGGDGGNVKLTYSTAGFIPRFNQYRKQHSIIILQMGGTGGKSGRYGKINGQDGKVGEIKLVNMNLTQNQNQ